MNSSCGLRPGRNRGYMKCYLNLESGRNGGYLNSSLDFFQVEIEDIKIVVLVFHRTETEDI